MQLHPFHPILRKKNHLIAMIATFDSKKKQKKQGDPIVMENLQLSMYFYEIFAIIFPWRIVLHLAL